MISATSTNKWCFKFFAGTLLLMLASLTSAQVRPPNFSPDAIPETSFTCEDKITGGYYADQEADCQLFHVCVQVSEYEVRIELFEKCQELKLINLTYCVRGKNVPKWSRKSPVLHINEILLTYCWNLLRSNLTSRDLWGSTWQMSLEKILVKRFLSWNWNLTTEYCAHS